MRLDINSKDRLGITQEILSTFVKHGWNLAAMEMFQFHTFVYIDESEISLDEITDALFAIDGVENIRVIDYLPTEQKRRHLDALLTKLPDPIVDMDINGDILATNQAAELAFGVAKEALEHKNIADLTNIKLADIVQNNASSQEVLINNKSFFMDITPVHTNNKNTGALIIFRSPERMGQQISALQKQQVQSIDTIVGKGVKIKAIKQQTVRFSTLDLPVLIRGETGTGKELIARALHDSGPRANAPFLAINCATFSENLLESELFGYAAGAFTGAQRGGKPGLLEMAEKGTVFLDEIGEMSTYLQAKLLRFLQDFTFRRIGGSNEIKADIRIVCATHRDLELMTNSHEFREDLFYRLNVLSIQLPPLRERTEDIPELVSYFANHAAEQLNVACPTFSDEAIALLMGSAWPGNIRQLQNVIFRTLALNEKPTINAQDICYTASQTVEQNEDNNYQQATNLDVAVEQFEKTLLSDLYQHYPSTRKLAKRLNVSHAKISRKLKKYGIGKIN